MPAGAGDNIQISEGSGKRLAAGATYTENAQTVRDEKVIIGEPYLAHYRVVPSGSPSLGTGSAHLLQIMAGASLGVMVRRIRVYQVVAATAASVNNITVYRLSTAGTGGTVYTPAPVDTADGASGATSMTLPTVKGTETTLVGFQAFLLYQTAPTSGGGLGAVLLAEWDFDKLRSKGLRIPAGTANGIAVKLSSTASAGAAVLLEADITEMSF